MLLTMRSWRRCCYFQIFSGDSGSLDGLIVALLARLLARVSKIEKPSVSGDPDRRLSAGEDYQKTSVSSGCGWGEVYRWTICPWG